MEPRTSRRFVRPSLMALAWAVSLLAHAQANLDSSTYLLNPPKQARQLSLQYEYVDDRLDVLDFAERASRTSRLDRERALHLGLWWQLNSSYQIHASGFERRARVLRTAEPFRIDGQQRSVSLGVRRVLGEGNQVLNVQLNHFDVDDLAIDRYQLGATTFGVDVILLDPQTLTPLPAAQIGIGQSGFELDYARAEQRGALRYVFSAGYRFANVKPDVSSVLFEVTDPVFLGVTVDGQTVASLIAQLKQTLPQPDNWNEHIFNAGVALMVPLSPAWSTSWSLRGFAINRSQYEPGPAEDEITSNVVLDGALTWSVNEVTTMNLSGRIYSNYLAGTDPGVYNRRVARLFDKSFGTLSVGITHRF